MSNYVFKVIVRTGSALWGSYMVSAKSLPEAIKKAEKHARNEGCETPRTAEAQSLGELI